MAVYNANVKIPSDAHTISEFIEVGNQNRAKIGYSDLSYIEKRDGMEYVVKHTLNDYLWEFKRYAKTVKRIQNAYCQALTDAINLILLDKGLTNYINQFTIRMQAPTTQEEKDRKENLAQTISNIRDIMDLLADIDDKVTKLEVLKSLLAGAVNDTEVLTAIQAEIDRIESEDTEMGGDEGEDFDSEEMGDMDFGDIGDIGGEEELPTPGEVGSTPMEAPEEGFETGEGELLAEDNLPSFAELGINYTDAN